MLLVDTRLHPCYCRTLQREATSPGYRSKIAEIPPCNDPLGPALNLSFTQIFGQFWAHASSRHIAAMNSQQEKPLLTKDRILHAAIDLADVSGLDALSMRKLASSLGVEAMSLYNHVKNKDALLDGMIDLVVSEMHLPNPNVFWRDEVRKSTISAHLVLMKHRWAPIPLVSRVNIGPFKLKYFDALHGCFLNGGFPHILADRARNVIDGHLYGFTLQKLLFPLEADIYAETAKHFLPLIPQSTHPFMHALTEEVIFGRYDGMHHFEFGLDLILNSLSELLDSRE